MLLSHLIDSNQIEIEKDQLNFINGLIRGDRRTNYDQDWVYEVVSSKNTGLDMDRFDYMRRDPLHLGQQDLVFHPQIYLDNFKIIDG
jgi:HD superfamily phosphohydrolase